MRKIRVALIGAPLAMISCTMQIGAAQDAVAQMCPCVVVGNCIDTCKVRDNFGMQPTAFGRG